MTSRWSYRPSPVTYNLAISHSYISSMAQCHLHKEGRAPGLISQLSSRRQTKSVEDGEHSILSHYLLSLSGQFATIGLIKTKELNFSLRDAPDGNFFDHAKIMRAHSGHPQDNTAQSMSRRICGSGHLCASEILYLLWPLKSTINYTSVQVPRTSLLPPWLLSSCPSWIIGALWRTNILSDGLSPPQSIHHRIVAKRPSVNSIQI